MGRSWDITSAKPQSPCPMVPQIGKNRQKSAIREKKNRLSSKIGADLCRYMPIYADYFDDRDDFSFLFFGALIGTNRHLSALIGTNRHLSALFDQSSSCSSLQSSLLNIPQYLFPTTLLKSHLPLYLRAMNQTNSEESFTEFTKSNHFVKAGKVRCDPSVFVLLGVA